MFSLFPNSDAPLSGWVSQFGGPLALFVVVIGFCTLLALHYGPQSGGGLDLGTGSDDCGSGGGGDSCGD
jgi:hypothetical protein